MSTVNIKSILEKYVELDDELKVLSKTANALRKERNSIGDQITDFLEKNQETTSSPLIEMGKNSFKIVKYTKKKINKDNIQEVLQNKIKNEDEVRILMEEIVEEDEQRFLKRTVKK